MFQIEVEWFLSILIDAVVDSQEKIINLFMSTNY